jgi:hypothetical protein
MDESEKIFRFWVVFLLIVIAAGGFAHVAQVLSPIATGIGILGILGLLVGILVGALWLLYKIGDYAIRGWHSALVKYAVLVIAAVVLGTIALLHDESPVSIVGAKPEKQQGIVLTGKTMTTEEWLRSLRAK